MINFSDKFKIMCKRRGVRLQDVAAGFGCTRQNLSRRLAANSWTMPEAERLAALIGCTFEAVLHDPDGEII